MASYHCSIKPVSRGGGRSSTAAAAYRAGVCLVDERTGEIHDYTRKQGVEHSELVFPAGVNMSREQLWNAAENAEKRKDARVAREFEIALPAELTQEQRRELAADFTKSLVDKFGVAADVAVHEPSRKGDQRNHHAHILITTRQISAQGLGEKTDLEREDKALRAQGKPSGREQIEALRADWATRCNRTLEHAGHDARVDHRSLTEQGIDREPTRHMGPVATAMERRGKTPDRTRQPDPAPRRREDEPMPRLSQELRQAQSELEAIEGILRREKLREQIKAQEKQKEAAREALRRQEEVKQETQRKAETEKKQPIPPALLNRYRETGAAKAAAVAAFESVHSERYGMDFKKAAREEWERIPKWKRLLYKEAEYLREIEKQFEEDANQRLEAARDAAAQAEHAHEASVHVIEAEGFDELPETRDRLWREKQEAQAEEGRRQEEEKKREAEETRRQEQFLESVTPAESPRQVATDTRESNQVGPEADEHRGPRPGM